MIIEKKDFEQINVLIEIQDQDHPNNLMNCIYNFCCEVPKYN